MCNGRLFAEMPPSLMKALATQNITYNLHSAGVTPGKHLKLEEAVSVLATSVDRGGRPFVAAMEHRSLPIYGTQFHPEKPEFVPNTARTHIPKTHNAKAVGSLLGEFFVNATRSAIAVAAYN
jgi:gamma-glutamyl hydrolase|eukprot:SAG25_NODE_1247_length_3497_cov_2.523543_2_plen_122_part_00